MQFTTLHWCCFAAAIQTQRHHHLLAPTNLTNESVVLVMTMIMVKGMMMTMIMVVMRDDEFKNLFLKYKLSVITIYWPRLIFCPRADDDNGDNHGYG